MTISFKTEADPPTLPKKKSSTKDDKSSTTDNESTPGAPHFVQGMGLFSATAIVMGSMIGSGIFIVSADMSRVLGSPAFLIGAWLVTAVMTIIGALSYGELAAMMPKAGGQYVYLREALGPLWGFLYGWTLFLVIQTGTVAAVGVAFGKFLGVFFPDVSQKNWLVHLGNGNIGLNTANLAAIVVITLLTLTNTRGVKLGAAVQNVFTSAKVLALLGVVGVGFVAKNAVAITANFGAGWHSFWAGAGWGTTHAVQVGANGPTQFVGLLTVVAVVQVGSLFSSDSWNNVTFTAGEIKNPRRNLPLSLVLGTGVVLVLYLLCNFVYLSVLPMAGDVTATTVVGRGIQFASEDGGDGGDGVYIRCSWGEADGRGNPDFDVRVCEWTAAFGGAGLLRDEPRRTVLQERREAGSEVKYPGKLVVGAVGVDLPAMSFGQLWATARLRDFCCADLLHPYDRGPVCAAADAAG